MSNYKNETSIINHFETVKADIDLQVLPMKGNLNF